MHALMWISLNDISDYDVVSEEKRRLLAKRALLKMLTADISLLLYYC
jgi:hypothetical protein